MMLLPRILKSRWVIALVASLAIYMLSGFLLVPLLLQRYLPTIASEQLQRPVTLGQVRFNPLLFKLEMRDFALKEPQGEPLVTLGRLFADLEVKSLLRLALSFRIVRLENLLVRPVIAEDGRLNFAKLADDLPPSEEPKPSPDRSALPRLLIDRFVLADGTVEFIDRFHGQPVSERLEAINLRLENISTLPDRQASHHVSASFEDGSVFDWHGRLSLNPLASEGQLRLDGFDLSTPWPFLKHRVALAAPEGRLGFAAGYHFRQDGDHVDLALSDIGVTLTGLKLLPVDGKEPILSFENIGFAGGSFNLADQSARIPEFTFQSGLLKAAIDERGVLDWQQLSKSTQGQSVPSSSGATAPSSSEPAAVKPWHLDIESLKLGNLALKLSDASRRLPVEFTVGAFGLGLKLGLEAGAGDPKVTVDRLASEFRNIVLKPIDGEEPLLAIEAVRLDDGSLDLARRSLKFPVVSISKGAVRTEVDDGGQMNWQKLADTAAASSRTASPAGRAETSAAQTGGTPPAEAPWRVEVEQLKIEGIGVGYLDRSRRTPIRLDIASFGLGLRAALEAGAGEPKVMVDGLQSEIRQIVLREQPREKPLASLASFELAGGQIDLAKNSVAIQQITLGGGDAAIERNEKGVIRLVELFASKDEGKLRKAAHAADTAAKAEGKPWHLAIVRTSVNGFRAAFVDRSVTPPLNIELRNADFELKNLSNSGKVPVAFNGKLHAAQGGNLAVQGTALPTGERGQAEIRLDRLNLVGLQPYVTQVGALRLENGNLSSRLKLDFQQKAGKLSLSARGDVSSAGLLLKEVKSGKRFAEWDKLIVDGIDFSLQPDKLAIKEVHAVKPGANFEIFEDRTTNVAAIFQPKKGTAPAPKPKTVSDKRAAGKPFPVSVQRVKVDGAVLDFSDLSLVLPFKTRIQNFGGTISGISNAPAARTLLKLDGRVDEYGEANLEGTLNLMQHNAFSDVTLIFRNVDMSSLSPYSGTFAGRRIQSGKLNAELQYKIENSKLASHGRIDLDQVALGADVVSPKAQSLPLDLALAILEDGAGRISVSIPVEGDVNDPQFSYGGVIWGAIVNLITKVVTAPFTAIAGAFGGGEEDMGEIFFIPGKSGLPPAEIEKLKKVANGLGTRPSVILKVTGTFDPKLDAKALKSWEVRNQVTERLGISVAPGEDPGPLSFDSAKTQRALEKLADERGQQIAAAALAAFRDQNRREPRRIGAFASLLDKASEDASFYQLLFERLVESAPLPPNGLEGLAERRSRVIVKELGIYKGIGPNRIRQQKVAPADEKDGRIPSKLDLAVGRV